MTDVLKISHEHERVDDAIEAEISLKFDELLKSQANPLADTETNLKPDNMVDTTLSLDEAKQLLDNEAVNQAESKKAQTLVDVVKGMKTEYLVKLLHKELQSNGQYISFPEMKDKKIRSFLTQAICEREGYNLSTYGVDTLAGIETQESIQKIQQEKLGLDPNAQDKRLRADGFAGPGFWTLYEGYLNGKLEEYKAGLSSTENIKDSGTEDAASTDSEIDKKEKLNPIMAGIGALTNDQLTNPETITYLNDRQAHKILDHYPDSSIDLSHLTSATADAMILLAKHPHDILLSEPRKTQYETLKGSQSHLTESQLDDPSTITQLTPHQAATLVQNSTGDLYLDGLTSLDTPTAAALATLPNGKIVVSQSIFESIDSTIQGKFSLVH